MPQQEHDIHISEFCARVYRQHERECGTPPSEASKNIGAARREYFGEPDPLTDFDDTAAEAEWSYKWGQRTPDVHLDSIPPDDDVYEGFDAKPRPIDSLAAYIVEHALIRLEDAVEYIYQTALRAWCMSTDPDRPWRISKYMAPPFWIPVLRHHDGQRD